MITSEPFYEDSLPQSIFFCTDLIASFKTSHAIFFLELRIHSDDVMGFQIS